ncbi:GNAT family N-acetyltransferase [Portibacter marinus]|uniref:GNAT family N-acetyltransferase n=1 Tax=Portibacter marinus TaxID=2898660 RepID=UPI001F200EDA|nr:GNAT family N-acetyltransferase [Portibacter marinus]
MSKELQDKQISKFFDIIYRNFKFLKEEGDVFYHFWYGDKKQVIRMFQGMSFPSIKDQEAMGKIKTDKLLVVCATNREKEMVYGAGIISLESKDVAHLLSFVIHPEHRNNNLGKDLIRAIEEVMKLLNLALLKTKFRTYWKSNEHWNKLLDKTGWTAPQTLIYYFTIPDIKTQFDTQWFKYAKLPEPFYIEEWGRESLKKLKDTLALPEWQGMVPESLNPIQMPKKILPHVSLILMKGNEVAGWLICHLLEEDIVQATSMYINPKMGKGLGMALIAEGSKRRKLGVQVIFMVEKHNHKMLNMVRKHFDRKSTNEYELQSRSLVIEKR